MAPLCLAVGGEQAVIADGGGDLAALARQFQRGLSAHAIADHGSSQPLGTLQSATGGQSGTDAGAIDIDIGAQRVAHRMRGGEVLHRLAIEIGDQHQIAVTGKLAGARRRRRSCWRCWGRR
jgi:hypothetical protein